MKPTSPIENQTRFSGNLRHYHRSGSQTQRSWDDWVGGGTSKPSGSKIRMKAIYILVGVIALGGIIAGLVVELG